LKLVTICGRTPPDEQSLPTQLSIHVGSWSLSRGSSVPKITSDTIAQIKNLPSFPPDGILARDRMSRENTSPDPPGEDIFLTSPFIEPAGPPHHFLFSSLMSPKVPPVAIGRLLSPQIKKYAPVINNAPMNCDALPLALNGLSLPTGQPAASPAAHPRRKSAQSATEDHRNDPKEIRNSGNTSILLMKLRQSRVESGTPVITRASRR